MRLRDEPKLDFWRPLIWDVDMALRALPPYEGKSYPGFALVGLPCALSVVSRDARPTGMGSLGLPRYQVPGQSHPEPYGGMATQEMPRWRCTSLNVLSLFDGAF